jgi:hypothetical protein
VQQVAGRRLVPGAQTAWHDPRVKQRLSNAGTAAIQYAVIPICGLATLGGAVAQFLVGAVVLGAVWAVLGLALLVVICGKVYRCKRVYAGERGLLVGPDADPVEIPFAQITGIEENLMTNPRIVTVSLDSGDPLLFLSAGGIEISGQRVRPSDYLRVCVQNARKAS